MAKHDKEGYEDRAITPARVTALWREINKLRKQPIEDRARLFAQLGVPADAQQLIAELLDRWGDINVFEPGVFVADDVCNLGWQPSVLAPVFYGFRDFGTAEGLSTRIRVFFPSIDGSPQNAQILTGCGRYPLVAFLHGQCNEPDRYLKWDLVPSQLARSGYVVVLPELSNGPPFGDSNPEVELVEQVLLWMRTVAPCGHIDATVADGDRRPLMGRSVRRIGCQTVAGARRRDGVRVAQRRMAGMAAGAAPSASVSEHGNDVYVGHRI
jgi:hypothetical protein